MHLDFKQWLQISLLDPTFGDIEFYHFSVDQPWYNGLSNNYIITIVKDVYQFSQSIARQKNKRWLQLEAIIGPWLT